MEPADPDPVFDHRLSLTDVLKYKHPDLGLNE
jgi:hypothetical protein